MLQRLPSLLFSFWLFSCDRRNMRQTGGQVCTNFSESSISEERIMDVTVVNIEVAKPFRNDSLMAIWLLSITWQQERS